MSTYTTTVGIEVHAELKTKSKMFCGCENNPHASEPNAHVCPVCMAHPGTLPTVNKQAIQFLLQVGRSIGGELAEYSEFDRKNYFYPDIPKAYQISQYQFPFVTKGEIGGVKITRVHLEEDTARSVHDQGDDSLVDFNRAGVPLMELVTEPVIHTSKQAGDFARELQLLLRTLGVSDAHMEKGEMRVEANISVSKTDILGTKVEVKNLNSFKSVEAAIEYETKRHIEELEAGRPIQQETRGWDEAKGKTYLQRVKETAHDYRYFPDPDIPKFKRSEISEFNNSRIDEMLPESPQNKRIKYRDLGLDEKQIEIIIADIDSNTFFEKVLKIIPKGIEARTAANYFITDIMSLMDQAGLRITDSHPSKFVELLQLLNEGKINSRIAKDLLKEAVFDGIDPEEMANSRGLLQQNSEEDLRAVIEVIISENPSVVAEYKAGKESSIQFLVGQGMKATKGSANPILLLKLFKEKLS